MNRILRTATFRLVALYVALFGGSVAALGAVVLWTTHVALLEQLEARISAESAALVTEYQEGGPDRLATAVHSRERTHPAGPLKYFVAGRNGTRLAGDLPSAPSKDGFQNGRYPENDGDFGHLRLLTTTLNDESRLTVAGDLEQIGDIEAIILGAFGSAFGAVLALGIAGGVALSTAFLKRIDTITRTAEAIIAGDLRLRVPLRGTDDDLDRLAATLNRMLDRIGALVESLRQVSNDIAHDLRTPLTRLRQRLEDAERHAGSVEEFRKATEAAISHADDLLATFSALLRIAQIEAGTRRAGFRRVDLSNLFGTVVEAFLPVAEDDGRSLISRLEPGIVVEGDRELLTQMIANLVENSIRHTPKGTQIAVNLHKVNGRVMAIVSDNGPGVPCNEREQIFKRFYRLERSRSTSGNGLGLSMVAAIAELHGIGIEVADNHPGLMIRLFFNRHS
nr:ATP-binding protein [Microvirga puerhi]